ncbi:g6430 [Coccomyxa elongata]
MKGSWSQDCFSPPEAHVREANLTSAEAELLPLICWRNDTSLQQHLLKSVRKGIPSGVTCKATQWCDHDGLCTEVCERGTVEVEQWLGNAIKTQLQLVRRLPFCLAQLLGTHNSAISLADGYGNRDEYFQEYFKWIRWVSSDSTLRTNDQYLSLTDQLNLGVRAVELDTHWVEGELRIAHCGGFHAGPFNVLIRAVNVVASLLGHPIHWDTETVGCDPSLSSIPVTMQRSFADALAELSAWLSLPENKDEFLVVFLDDQMDILTWGYLPQLLREIQEAFPAGSIYTPPEHASHSNASWPSMNDLLREGKRIMFVSGEDYGAPMASLLFERSSGTVCGWQEPPLADFGGPPSCIADGRPVFPGNRHTLTGTLFRVTTCELLYGPLNCGFIWKSDNLPVLDELSLPAVAECGVNMPCPDLLTPQRAAAAIWSWAPGHPYDVPAPPAVLRIWHRALSWLLHALSWRPHLQQEDPQLCAVISSKDGRWRAAACSADIPSACRDVKGGWLLKRGERGQCADGTRFDVPHHSKENLALQRLLLKSGAMAAWLPLQGPDWSVPSQKSTPDNFI